MAKFSPFSETIYKQKYSHKNGNNQKENWTQISKRVVNNVLSVVTVPKDIKKQIIQYIDELKFIPGGRYLYAAGLPYHQTQNCFLFKAQDSREGWADLLQKSALALMTGGGIGTDYSLVREEGRPIRKIKGTATGPLSLCCMVNEAARYIRQGGSRRCLDQNSLIHTERGLIFIKDIDPLHDKVLTLNGYKKVLNKFQQGIQKTVLIQTQIGEFRCTGNHKIAVLTDIESFEWKQAKDLKPQDRLIFSNLLTKGINTTFPINTYEKPERAYTVKDIKIPTLDADMAWFIGYFQGNGHSAIRYKTPTKRNSVISISLPTNAYEAIKKVKKCLENFNINCKISKGDGDCIVVKASSIPLAIYIQKYIKVSHEPMEVPEFIFKGTSDIRSAFLAGVYDSDGSNSGRPLKIMSCIHKSYLKQIQCVSASLGFVTHFGYTRPKRGNWNPLYNLCLKGTKQEKIFNNTVGKFILYKKFKPTNRIKELFSYSFTPIMIKNNTYINKKQLHKNYKVNYPIEKIEKVLGKSLIYTPIQVIDVVFDNKKIPTFDIEVEDEHSFFCGGYLVHNSAIWAGLKWDHPDIYKFINSKNWIKEVRELKLKDFSFPAQLDMTNISVLLNDDFFEAYNNDKNPQHSMAHSIYWATIERMLKTSEPGFSIDIGKNKNETLRNACSEVTSSDDSDVCNLGSINLGKIDSLEEMKDVVDCATIFLLAGTIYSDVPFSKVDEIRNKNRRIGLGLMGIHEFLLKRNKPYGPDDGLEKYLKIYNANKRTAIEWANKWDISKPVKTQAVAPTGTIAIVGGTTTGIEPLFCSAYKRRYLKGKEWHYQYVIDNITEKMIETYGLHPDDIEDAYSLSKEPERRMKFQQWIQGYVDHAISSTMNIPAWGSVNNNKDTIQDWGNLFLNYLPNLRGFTIYADGSRGGQPLQPIKYETAKKYIGEVFRESNDICDITGTGTCSS